LNAADDQVAADSGRSSEEQPMADRVAELLAKGKVGKLSAQEKEELARFLNAPILDPLENPPARFVSKHRMTESDVPARLKAIDWFAKCGEPAEFDLTMNVERVKTWPQAMKECGAQSWEDVQLEAQNQLTLTLHNRDRERYQDWNDITRRFKNDVITPLTKKVWQPFQKAHGLDINLVHSVQWDILAAMMENAHISSNHGSFFFLELLTVYETGHFPCEWRGKWPQGELLVD